MNRGLDVGLGRLRHQRYYFFCSKLFEEDTYDHIRLENGTENGNECII